MKYTSTINNLKVIEWQITLSQAFLIDILVTSELWANRITIDDTDYRWVSKGKIIEEIPHVFKNTDTVYRALKELDKKSIIEYKKQGRKDLIRVTKKGKEWVFDTNIPVDNSKLGNKSDFANSEINPKNEQKLGNKSEKTAQNSDLNPTDNNTNINNNTNNNITSEKTEKPKPKKRKTDFVEFEFTDKQKSKAEEYGLNLSELLEEFKDCHQSKGNKFVDWSKAFNTWITNHIRWNKLKPLSQQTVDIYSQGISHPSHQQFAPSQQPQRQQKQANEPNLPDPKEFVYFCSEYFYPLAGMTTVETHIWLMDKCKAENIDIKQGCHKFLEKVEKVA